MHEHGHVGYTLGVLELIAVVGVMTVAFRMFHTWCPRCWKLWALKRTRKGFWEDGPDLECRFCDYTYEDYPG